MKRFALILTACLCLAGLLPGCGAKPVYMPQEIPSFSSIADTVQVQLTDDTGKVWLDNSHFASVEIKTGQDGIWSLSPPRRARHCWRTPLRLISKSL